MKRLAVAFVLLLAGCGNAPVDLDLQFPSEQAFLLSDFGRLLVYELDPETGLGDCPALLEAAVAGDVGEPTMDSGQLPVCDFREPGVGFDDFPPGPHAFLVLSLRDNPQATLLAGCRVAEAYAEAPSVEVTMYPTRMYEDAVGGETSSCTVESKCNGSCQ